MHLKSPSLTALLPCVPFTHGRQIRPYEIHRSVCLMASLKYGYRRQRVQLIIFSEAYAPSHRSFGSILRVFVGDFISCLFHFCIQAFKSHVLKSLIVHSYMTTYLATATEVGTWAHDS